MARARTSGPARAYLANVETALWDVDADLRTEILEGLSEELDGLASSEARVRISQMGPAELIAAEAKLQLNHHVPKLDEQTKPRADSYSAIAALMVIFGGVLIPFIGYFVGYGMVWASSAWTLRQKKRATWTLALSLAFAAAAVAFASTVPLGSGPNPDALIPAWFEAAKFAMTFVLLTNVVVGIRLFAIRGSH